MQRFDAIACLRRWRKHAPARGRAWHQAEGSID